MRINFYLSFLLSFSSFISVSQVGLKGTISDTKDHPIPYANVVLYSAKDSTSVILGTISTEEGDFVFPDVPEDRYYLKVSFVGYEDYTRTFNLTEPTVLEEIVLQEASSSLSEVSITYKNPTITREVDRLVFKVENTTLSSGSTWDILKRTPGVIASNESLRVRNQSVQVYINDRKVHLSAEELKSLLEYYSGENIASIEVITTPPARYDAEGGAILNIVTTKSISLGYKGSLEGSYTQADYPKFSLGTSHYYQTDQLNIFGNYSYSARKEYKEDQSYINFIRSNEVVSKWNTDFDRISRLEGHNANLILDYELGSKSFFNISSSLTYSPGKRSENEALTSIEDNLAETPAFIETYSSLEEDLLNLAIDLEYKYLIEDDSELKFKGHHTVFDQEKDQELITELISQNLVEGNSEFSTLSDQQIDIWTGQVDFISDLLSGNFEAGAKYSFITSDSKIDYSNFSAQETPFDSDMSDHFLYKERIYAAYLSWGRDWEDWKFKTGLRAEKTEREGNSLSLEQIDNRSYTNLFPTVYLQHSLDENHTLSLDYSRRISRPKYESLNPFRYYLSLYDYNAGNPNLRAAVSDNLTLSYTLKNSYFIDIYYKDNGSFPEVLSFQDNELMTVKRVSVNMLESHSYGLDFSHGRSLNGWWYAYLYASLFHEDITFVAIESGNEEVTNEADGLYGSLYNSLVLSKDGTFTGEVTLTYISDWISGSYNLEPMTTLSLGLRKTLWNQRAELSLNLNDILNATNSRLTSQYLNQSNSYLPYTESRYLSLGFKYNFGNFRLSDNQRDIEAVERERL